MARLRCAGIGRIHQSKGTSMTQEALKLALDALETELSIDWTNNDEFNASAEKMHKAIAAIKEALAQRTEPPAWFPAVENILNEYGLQAIDFVADFKEAMKDAEQSQRTWVGLSDDEMETTFIECGGKWNGDFWKIEDADFHPFLRTIEAKLKEKNT